MFQLTTSSATFSLECKFNLKIDPRFIFCIFKDFFQVFPTKEAKIQEKTW